MDDNTHDIIDRIMDQAIDNIILAERYNILINMLIDGAELDYTGKALRVGNDESIMSYLHAIRTTEYRKKLEALQKEKENKNGK